MPCVEKWRKCESVFAEKFCHELKVLETEGKEYEVLCGRADIERKNGKIIAVPRSDAVVLKVDDRYYVYFYKWWTWYRCWREKRSHVLVLNTHKCKNGLCGERVYAIYGDAEIVNNFVCSTPSIICYDTVVDPKSDIVIIEHEHYDAETHPKRVWCDHYVYCKDRWLVPMGLA